MHIQFRTSKSKAMRSKECEEWKQPIQREMNSLLENGTLTVVSRLEGVNVLKNKWFFKPKSSPNNIITDKDLKSRLVVKGFTQREEIDYNETFSPVCTYESVQVLLSLAAAKGLETIQFDIATAFLNSTLEEETYMEQTQGFEVGDKTKVACKGSHAMGKLYISLFMLMMG